MRTRIRLFAWCAGGVVLELLSVAAHADVTIDTQLGIISARASTVEDFIGVTDENQLVDQTLFTSFSFSPTAVVVGSIVEPATTPPFDVITATTTGDASGNANIQVLTDGDGIRITGAGSFTTHETKSPENGIPNGPSAEASALFEAHITVSGAPNDVRFTSLGTLSSQTASDLGASNARINFLIDPDDDGLQETADSLHCGSSATGCGQQSQDISVTLQPGGYQIAVSITVDCSGGGSSSASIDASWVMTLGSPGCEIKWNTAGNGDYGVAANWLPQIIPSNGGDGCDDILFDLPGDYTVSLAGATRSANSILVRTGEPKLSGTSISLPGNTQDGVILGTPKLAIGIGANGSLVLENTTVSARNVLVGDLPGAGLGSFLDVRSGATLSVTESIVLGGAQNASLLLGGGTTTSANAIIGNGSTSQSFASVSNGATWNTGALEISKLSEGRLVAELGGILTSSTVKVGNVPAKTGTVELTGTNTQWTATGLFSIGTLGTGNVEVNDGASLTAGEMAVGDLGGEGADLSVLGADGTDPSTVTVNGPFKVGAGSAGVPVARIREGAKIVVNGDAVIGDSDLGILGVGVANAENDERALLDVNGTLTIGKGGAGTAIIENGGQIDAEDLVITNGTEPSELVMSVGNGNTSTVTPRLIVSGNTTVGQKSLGEFTMSGGAEAFLNGLVLGDQTDGNGTVSISGVSNETQISSTLSVGGPLDIGLNGRGTMTAENGGVIDGDNRVFVGSFTVGGKSEGVLTIRTAPGNPQSRLNTLGEIRIGGDLGVARVLGESVMTTATTLRITANGTLSVTNGAVITATGGTTNSGIFETIPGDGSKAVGPPLITGDFTNDADGKLSIKLGAGAPGLHITGNANLDGTLEISFSDEEGLTGGDMFEILDVDGTSDGDFAQTVFPTRSPDFDGTLTKENGVLRVLVNNPGTPIVQDIVGDINGDSEVDAVDVQLVINAALGIDITPLDGNVNGDANVDAVDVQLTINAALGL